MVLNPKAGQKAGSGQRPLVVLIMESDVGGAHGQAVRKCSQGQRQRPPHSGSPVVPPARYLAGPGGPRQQAGAGDGREGHAALELGVVRLAALALAKGRPVLVEDVFA